MDKKNGEATTKRIKFLVERRKRISTEVGKIGDEVESLLQALPSEPMNREKRRKIKKSELRVEKLRLRFEGKNLELEEITKELDGLTEGGDTECSE